MMKLQVGRAWLPLQSRLKWWTFLSGRPQVGDLSSTDTHVRIQIVYVGQKWFGRDEQSVVFRVRVKRQERQVTYSGESIAAYAAVELALAGEDTP